MASTLAKHRNDRKEVSYVCAALARELEGAGAGLSAVRCERMAESLRRAERFLAGSEAPEDRPMAAPPETGRTVISAGGVTAPVESGTPMADRCAALKAVRMAYNSDEMPNAEEWVRLAAWLLTGSTRP